MDRVRYVIVPAGAAPASAHWLSPAERETLTGLSVPKRREDWLLGRFAAKTALSLSLGYPASALGELEVRAAPSGTPEAFQKGERLPVTLSIAHAAGRAASAVAALPLALGCDLEAVEARDPAFLEDFFTSEERRMVARASGVLAPLLVNLLWSAKESAAKALGEGLRRDTRTLEVAAEPSLGFADGWRPLAVRDIESSRWFRGWWRLLPGAVLTVLGGGPIAPPEELRDRSARTAAVSSGE